ncbi:MAG: phosphotransferase family protein [Candidatus Dormibacteria bacterium]
MEAIRSGLERWLARTHPGIRVDAVDPIPEGHSGFTYFVHAAQNGTAHEWVLRVPPPGARASGPADVARQGRIMAALHARGLPVPAIVAASPDPELDGRPFVLMDRIGGRRIEVTAPEFPGRDIAASAVEVLKRLHAVPIAATGIGEEAPVSLDEEMIRWNWLMQRAPVELTERAPVLGTLLARMRPPDPAPTLVHGDYHYGNMLFEQGRVVAVLDWEIAQIGAPMLDLGCLCVVAQRNHFEGAPNPGGGLEVDVDEVVGLYGTTREQCRWYLALSCYKYAAIFGYNLMLHRRGKRPDSMYEKLTGTIEGLIEQGVEALS